MGHSLSAARLRCSGRACRGRVRARRAPLLTYQPSSPIICPNPIQKNRMISFLRHSSGKMDTKRAHLLYLLRLPSTGSVSLHMMGLWFLFLQPSVEQKGPPEQLLPLSIPVSRFRYQDSEHFRRLLKRPCRKPLPQQGILTAILREILSLCVLRECKSRPIFMSDYRGHRPSYLKQLLMASLKYGQ